MLPKILISNDDGIYAPGLKELWLALSGIADTTIVAPHVEQSATGLSLTIRSPLKIEKIEWPHSSENKANAWMVNGTPGDCIRAGLSVILDSPPDMIITGINRGGNPGRNIFYSGTIAGAIEGVIHEIPSIAFSSCDYYQPNFSFAVKYIPKIVEYFLKHPIPSGTLMNVNFPSVEHAQVKGFRLAKHGKQYYAEDPVKRFHPHEKHDYYWLGAKERFFEEEEDSDIFLLKQGYVTAVPIQVKQLTDLQLLEERKLIFEKLFDG